MERIRTLSLVRLFSGIAVQLAASLEMFKPPLLFGAENPPLPYAIPAVLPDDTLNAEQVIRTILDASYHVGTDAGSNYGMGVLFDYCSPAGANAIRQARTPQLQFDYYMVTDPYQALFTHACTGILPPTPGSNDYRALLQRGKAGALTIVVATCTMQQTGAAGAPPSWRVDNMTLA